MPTTYYPEPDVIDALQECRALAFERGRAEGREESARFMRTAASLNGHGPNIFKAIETGEAFQESEQWADPHDALTLAYIDSLIESKTHDPESTDSEVGSVLSHWFSDPEAFSEALAEVDGLDAPTIEKAVRQIHKAWEEQQHPRDHGKFAESAGGEVATHTDDTSEQDSPAPEWHDLPSLQTAADGWAGRILKAAIRIPGSLMASVRARANAAYDRLSARYGKGFARAAVAAGLVGLAIPLPGASVLSAAPVVAIAELHRQLTQVKAEGEPTLIRRAASWLVDRVSGGTSKLKDDPIREVLQKAWGESKHKAIWADAFATEILGEDIASEPAFKSFVIEAFDVEYAAALNAAPEFRKTMLAEVILKAAHWDAALHPRDDHGRFISKEAIHEAKSDPAKAEALRSRVTDPTQRAKLDAALGGSVDLGRTKAGEAKEETERKRTDKSERLAKVRSLSNEISMARRGGEPVPASHFADLASHLPHLTVQELRSVRIKLAASFAGGRRRDEMAQALTRHAKNQVERLNAEEKYSDLDPLDFGSLTDYSNQFNSRGPHGNPNSAESHGGRMGQRAELDRAVSGKPVDTGSLNHVKERWADELLREGVHKAFEAKQAGDATPDGLSPS